MKNICEAKGIGVEVSDGVVAKLVDKADKKSGARGVAGVVKREIEDKISRFILENRDGEKSVFVTLDEKGEICVKQAAHY